MPSKISSVLLVSAVVALVVGVAAGYLARTGEISTFEKDLTKAKEGKGMIEEELKAAKANLAKATESKSMLEAELKGKPAAVRLIPEKGQMAHDLWLIIVPVEGGKYAISVRAEGLEAKGVYLVEGVTRTVMKAVPIAPTVPASEFVADEKGDGLYWLVLDKDPRVTFEKILILFLPEMQMEKAVMVAAATLG